MQYSLSERIRRSRSASALAVLAISIGLTLSSSVAQGRVDSGTASRAVALSGDTTAKVNGGGTVLAKPTYLTTVSSFGLNARRPVGFTEGGTAEGRINYVRHKNVAGRHVNVPVILMQAGPTPQPPNNTGGDALIVGDCDAPNAECPSGNHSAIVYVKDVADSGAGQDIFNIYFCTAFPAFPGVFVPGGAIQDCQGPEGDTLRSGNIQVRGDAAVVGEKIATGSGSGAYASTPNVNGVELAGGTFGIGTRTAGPGDLEAQLNGVSPLIGLFQQVTVSGWITTATVNGGTMTVSGTATLDMGDGAPPLTGLALTGSITATGVTLTVGSWSFGTLPLSDGFIKIE
jgi:hypothetical protein